MQAKTMHKTQHYKSRVQQRGILESTIDLAQRYGFPKGDKMILGKKQIQSALKDLDLERQRLVKAMDQGGVVAIEANGTLITAYRLNSFKRSLVK